MVEALLPYIEVPETTLIEHVPVLGAPLKVTVFGPLVVIGVIVGWQRGLKFARAKGMDEWLVRDCIWWQIVAGFVVAHWVSVIFYFPEQVAEDPWVLLQLTNGLSSVGGFFGAFLGMLFFLRRHDQPILPYLDLSMYGLLVGWCFGRLACTLVHDHPGRIVDQDFFLAVGPWPDGAYRYDLGLYEFVFTLLLAGYIHLIVRDKVFEWSPGRLTGLVATLYAPYRFMLDFLRIEDDRYVGLTTAQWSTIVFFIAAMYLLVRRPKPSDFRWKRGPLARATED